jgi:hypothetical protein
MSFSSVNLERLAFLTPPPLFGEVAKIGEVPFLLLKTSLFKMEKYYIFKNLNAYYINMPILKQMYFKNTLPV